MYTFRATMNPLKDREALLTRSSITVAERPGLLRAVIAEALFSPFGLVR